MPLDAVSIGALAICCAAVCVLALALYLAALKNKHRYAGACTENLLADRALEFRALVEKSPDTIARYDREARRVYANPAFLALAVTSAQPPSNGLSCEYSGIDYLEKVREVLHSGVDDEMECAWTTATGEPVTSHVRFISERDAAGQVVGVLSIGRDISAFKDTEHNLRESRASLRELTARRELEEVHARKEMARSMHEEYGQGLSALRMHLALLNMRFGKESAELGQKLGDAVALVDDTISNMRDMVAAIHPSVLNMGIASALEWLADDCMAAAELQREVCVTGEIEKIDERTTGLVYKIVQIALSNVLRHAEAKNVCITLGDHGQGYRLEVRDDGKGFDLDRSRKDSLGMVAMEELSHMLGGEIVFLSSPGKGTVIEVCFPATAAIQPALFEAL